MGYSKEESLKEKYKMDKYKDIYNQQLTEELTDEQKKQLLEEEFTKLTIERNRINYLINIIFSEIEIRKIK